MVKQHLERDIKVETLRRIIKECDEDSLPALKNQLIAFAGREWGTQRRTVIEYLEQLVIEGSIFIDGEDCWTFIRWEKIKKARELDYLHIEDILKGHAQATL